jgi:hypothetical protein
LGGVLVALLVENCLNAPQLKWVAFKWRDGMEETFAQNNPPWTKMFNIHH